MVEASENGIVCRRRLRRLPACLHVCLSLFPSHKVNNQHLLAAAYPAARDSKLTGRTTECIEIEIEELGEGSESNSDSYQARKIYSGTIFYLYCSN